MNPRSGRFHRGAILGILWLGAIAGAPTIADEPKPRPKVDFNYEIRPILSDKCFHCHGPDPKNQKAGLRLDVLAGATSETKSGIRAVVPGNLDDSELIARITSDDEDERMPPKSLGRSLSPSEVELLKRWIEEGAEWKDHWAFITPARTAPPEVAAAGRIVNPIDRFVIARLEAEGLGLAPEATRERLIRRLSFDLTGLPPSLDAIDAFVADARPDAYERLVDRLLASPRFGERMAVDWLDVARYADTFGYQADVYRAMWPWRDWVVNAFNTNLPYDKFISWQLAGDLAPRPSREQVLATAFNRHHRQTNEGGSIEEEWRTEYVADRTITFGSAFLGLTLECARCHTHKYDPITQNEFYSLFSFFNSIDESGLYSHFTDAVPTPTLRLTEADRERAVADVEKRLQSAEADLHGQAEARRPAFEAWLKSVDRKTPAPALAGRIGDFPLDAVDGGKTVNRADAAKPATVAEAPAPVEGRVGRALRFDGENSVTLPLGNFDRYQPFSLGLWIKTPDVKDRAVVLRRSMAWTDAGSRGYQILIEDGKLTAALVHFWPGNAIGIAARDPLPINKWVHVGLTYDGSSRADGLILYVDGKPAPREVVRDKLTKNITGGGGDDLVIGQRFRDRGFKNGEVDDVQVFNRALTAVEAAQLFDPTTIGKLLSVDPKTLADADRDSLFAYYLANFDADHKGRLTALEGLRKERSGLVDSMAEIMVMKELPTPRPTFVLRRGAYDAPGEQVSPRTPASLLAFPADAPRNRLGLARWLTDPRHPLTARVTVNRWWQSVFGRGLVATPEDFGSQGMLPSHPALLDWLARELVDSGWDVKRVLRLMVTSATYRQSSDASPELYARDPDNVLLAHGPRYRLPAEMVRDAALAASGQLVDVIGGPSVKPFQPAGLWEEKSNIPYVRDVGAGSHRRSMYTYWKRTSPPPAMLTFDAANREVCAVKRLPTATPLQALVLLNDTQYVEAARVLAERAAREGGSNLSDRLVFLVRVLTGRRPDDRELATLAALYRDQYDEFRSGRADADKLLAVGDAPRAPGVDPAEAAALTIVAQALLNYDETVMNR
ncbi:MAG: DUF1553 domain-containing protein [Paludisphaera borealis]|uniref:DUF1553 domain-containing protein n=1 Tax=Paludisphaera borealis TaxID=1387353 RepID=UPI0028417D02|nr:DUF1553 domain-containing protein [Paludisphaera borealis]MDR3623428.1 DUF1553 domain-containing protein [Paludisphaera borealis]